MCISYELRLFNELERSAKQHSFHSEHKQKALRGGITVYFIKTSKPSSKQAGKTVVTSHGIFKKLFDLMRKGAWKNMGGVGVVCFKIQDLS